MQMQQVTCHKFWQMLGLGHSNYCICIAKEELSNVFQCVFHKSSTARLLA